MFISYATLAACLLAVSSQSAHNSQTAAQQQKQPAPTHRILGMNSSADEFNVQDAVAAAAQPYSDAAGQAWLDGRYDDAEANYKAALKIYPTWGPYYVGLAESQAAQNEIYDAIATYRSLIYPPPTQTWGNSDESDIRTLMGYCLLLCETDQWTEAATIFNKTASAAPSEEDPQWAYPKFDPNGTPDYISLMAWAHLMLGLGIDQSPTDNYALDQFTQAMELKPNWEEAEFQYALTLQQVRRNDEARAILNNLDATTQDPVLKDALIAAMNSFR